MSILSGLRIGLGLLYMGLALGANPVLADSLPRSGDMRKLVVHEVPRDGSSEVFTDAAGAEVRLADFAGKVVVLNFWATWCPPCKKEMPLFQERYEAHAADGFTIVAVAVDEIDETRDFVFTFGIEFPVLIGQEEAIAAGREYGNRIGALPYSVVIDREGMVRETHRGEVTEADLDAWLKSYL